MHPDNVHTVYLIDTPGFNDTNRSDIDILTSIAHYLSVSYANRINISGIIFLHRISDNRMSSSMKRNINMFKKLVGETAYENVAITTTMWWDGEEKMNARKETQLREEYFEDVLDGGGSLFRYEAGTGVAKESVARQNAFEIVTHLIKKAKDGPVVLNIQSEIVDQNIRLDQTAAGKALGGEVTAARRELELQLIDA